MIELISRKQWGADNVKLQPMLNIPVSEVYIHHTVTPHTDDGAKDMRVLESSEQAGGVYITVAYTEVGHPNGNVYEGRGVEHLGAATKNKNSKSFAYSFFGNMMNEEPTILALESCAQRIAYWVTIGKVKKDFVLLPHKAVFNTACPGANLMVKLPSIYARIIEILGGNTVVVEAAPAPPKPVDNSVPYPGILLKRGSRGDSVRRLQQRLKDRGWRIDIDGIWGPKMDIIVGQFQKEKGLVQDRLCGRNTWNSIFNSPVT